MKYKHTFIAALLLGSFAMAPAFSSYMEIPFDVSQKAKPVTIRVLIGKELDRVLLEAKGSYHIYDPQADYLLMSGNNSKCKWMTPDANGLKWGEIFPAVHHLRLVPGDRDSSILIDGIQYKGCVEIYDNDGTLLIVNEVDIERYLKSTLTAIFPNELDPEVMDAIAIVERTKAYFIASQAQSIDWDVEAKESGYQGHALTLQNVHVDRAINNTQHMILTYQGVPFAATWTKDSAGTTADYPSIYRKELLSPPGVQSPFSAKGREKRMWNFVVSKAELARQLGLTAVTSLDLYKDQKSNKIYGVRVKDRAEFHSFDFFKLQKALGLSRLKSNDFTVQVSGDQLIFKGFGEGDGVGLCLFGASAMADRGEQTPRILSSFFPDTQLRNIRSF